MRRTMIVAAVTGLTLLAGCDSSTEPAPPPPSQDALTTATAAPATPSDEVEATTDAAPTSEAPTSEDAAVTSEPVASGVPEMPEEATEQTQEGALSFTEYFVEVVNYTGITPTPGLIAGISSEECDTCSNLEETVAYSADNSNFLKSDLWTVTGQPETLVFTEETALVRAPITQHELPVVDDTDREVDRTQEASYDMALDLVWRDGWVVRAVEFG